MNDEQKAQTPSLAQAAKDLAKANRRREVALTRRLKAQDAMKAADAEAEAATNDALSARGAYEIAAITAADKRFGLSHPSALIGIYSPSFR
jgi:hypothetical protein